MLLVFWLPGSGQGVLPQCFGCLAVVKACCHSVLVAWLWSRRADTVFWLPGSGQGVLLVFWLPGCGQGVLPQCFGQGVLPQCFGCLAVGRYPYIHTVAKKRGNMDLAFIQMYQLCDLDRNGLFSPRELQCLNDMLRLLIGVSNK